MKVTFWGAARTVTGSMHHLEIAGKSYLLDCGLYQGRRKEAENRNRDLPFEARSIAAVVLAANLGTAALIFTFTPFVTQIGLQFWFLAGALHGIVAARASDRV